jgi:DNA-binding CsgD family transcriptional regulator
LPPIISSEDLLHLFRTAREAQGEAFRDACFDWLQRYVGFDVLLLACAPPSKLSFGQALTRGLSEPRAMFESYAGVAHLDILSQRMLQCAGTVQALNWDAPELAGERFRPYREHVVRFGMPHAGGIALLTPDGANIFVLVLARGQVGQRLNEAELSALAFVAPYVAEAMQIHQMGSWRTTSELGMDELPVALVDDKGCFKQLTPAFARAYFREQQIPQGYLYLSEECLSRIAHGESWSLPNHQSLYGVRDERGFLLRIRPRSKADLLSARERQVAYAYAAGSSYTEIAETLDIAPATVRRHLTNLYEKLAVSHRVDLIAALAD